MSTITEFTKELDQWAKTIPDIAVRKGGEIMFSLKNMLQEQSPVESGTYRGSWQFRFSPGGGATLFSAGISNDAPQATAMEEGSQQGSQPWPKTAKKTFVGPQGSIYPTALLRNGLPLGPLTNSTQDAYLDKLTQSLADALTGSL